MSLCACLGFYLSAHKLSRLFLEQQEHSMPCLHPGLDVRARAVSAVLLSVFLYIYTPKQLLLMLIEVKFYRGEEGLLLFSKMIREALFMLFSGPATLLRRSL